MISRAMNGVGTINDQSCDWMIPCNEEWKENGETILAELGWTPVEDLNSKSSFKCTTRDLLCVASFPHYDAQHLWCAASMMQSIDDAQHRVRLYKCIVLCSRVYLCNLHVCTCVISRCYATLSCIAYHWFVWSLRWVFWIPRMGFLCFDVYCMFRRNFRVLHVFSLFSNACIGFVAIVYYY